MTLQKAGSGSVEPEDFNALVDAVEQGDGGGGSQTLAQVLAEGNDGNQVGMTNVGALDTNDGSISAGTGSITNSGGVNLGGGQLTTGDGNIDMGDGNITTVGGEITVGDVILSPSGLNLNGNDLLEIDVLDHNGTTAGFFGTNPTTRPEVPATPLPQDIVDALVLLGLVTQAAP